MKMFKLLLFLVILLIFFNACRKDESGVSSATPKVAAKMDDLKVNSTFDWKTATQYKLTLTAKSTNAVIIVSPSGNVNRKYFLTKDTPFAVSLSFPSYQKSIHLLYNGKDIELALTSTTLTYAFNN